MCRQQFECIVWVVFCGKGSGLQRLLTLGVAGGVGSANPGSETVALASSTSLLPVSPAKAVKHLPSFACCCRHEGKVDHTSPPEGKVDHTSAAAAACSPSAAAVWWQQARIIVIIVVCHHQQAAGRHEWPQLCGLCTSTMRTRLASSASLCTRLILMMLLMHRSRDPGLPWPLCSSSRADFPVSALLSWVSRSRNEGLPLSLFHPFKRLPPEGTVSWGPGRLDHCNSPFARHGGADYAAFRPIAADAAGGGGDMRP